MRKDIQSSYVGEDTTHTLPFFQAWISSYGLPPLKGWWPKSHIQTIDCRNCEVWREQHKIRNKTTKSEPWIIILYHQVDQCPRHTKLNWKPTLKRWKFANSSLNSNNPFLPKKLSSSSNSTFSTAFRHTCLKNVTKLRNENWNNRVSQRHKLWW